RFGLFRPVLYYDATVKGREIPLIIDSGAAGSIVSCQLLNDLGIAIDRPSTTLMINVNGEQRRPLGEVLNFPVTIKGMTIPIDVVVTDAMDYSAIVGNNWLAKVKANIDYETSNMIIHWEGNEIEVPVEYLEMPMERQKKRKEQIRKEEEKDESEVEEEENDEEEIEEEESDYEEYEEENLDEKVHRYRRSLPKENFVLTKEGVGLDGLFYHWNYFSRLDEQFKRKAPRRVAWDYDWKGPAARCWCGNQLYSPSNECSQCLMELTNYITLQRLPLSIIVEMSSEADAYADVAKFWEITPNEIQMEEVVQIVDEQDRQQCFYCERLSQTEWEQKKEVPLYFGYPEAQPNETTQLSGLPMGQLTNEQESALIDLLKQY
ncbi:hypothetical protein RhiirA5_386188, partial [Rhizophagus irregularis]